MSDEAPTAVSTITDRERDEAVAANESGKQPVVFVHGLWLIGNSWDNFASFYAEAGYAPVVVGWPDDPETTEEARENPDAFAGKGVADIADHAQAVIELLDKKPVIIGHSFGGLLVQILAGRGLAAATVSISPAPYRGVLPLPYAALKSSFPVLHNPANSHRAVALTEDQFRYSFGNAVPEEESKALYEKYSVAGPGKPLFQAASANFNPWTEAKVDHDNPERGPLLIVGGTKDQTVPPPIYKASHKIQDHNEGVTEFFEFEGRGHSLAMDSGWKDVAEKSLEFVKANT
jgi:pimeloyl-ACP methyl ester carboxylesterase